MNYQFLNAVMLTATIATTFSACKKDDPPTPVEQELITTLRLDVSGENGFSKSFSYKIENGFGGGLGGIIQIDTLRLAPELTYQVSARVLNEKENPVEDITTEVIAERDEHLFLYHSAPATGAGSITFSNGSTDGQSRPFNQTIIFSTGTSGTGTLTVHLIHAPSDKSGSTPGETGGETDVEAVFPVVIQ